MKIARIDDSFHFPGRAVVITGDCGHKHVRPSITAGLLQPGDDMHCLFCDSERHTPTPTKSPANTWD
jgi:hypothetical protein